MGAHLVRSHLKENTHRSRVDGAATRELPSLGLPLPLNLRRGDFTRTHNSVVVLYSYLARMIHRVNSIARAFLTRSRAAELRELSFLLLVYDHRLVLLEHRAPADLADLDCLLAEGLT